MTTPRVAAEVVEAARTGDEAAFSVIYVAYNPLLLAYAKQLLGDHEEAEDATQETWKRAWPAIRRTQPGLKISGWLHRCLHNYCVDILRRRGRIQFSPLEGVDADDPGVPMGEEVERAETTDEVRRMLDALPPEEAQVLQLLHGEGLSIGQVAERLGIGKHVVRQRRDAGRARCVAYQDKLLSASRV